MVTFGFWNFGKSQSHEHNCNSWIQRTIWEKENSARVLPSLADTTINERPCHLFHTLQRCEDYLWWRHYYTRDFSIKQLPYQWILPVPRERSQAEFRAWMIHVSADASCTSRGPWCQSLHHRTRFVPYLLYLMLLLIPSLPTYSYACSLCHQHRCYFVLQLFAISAHTVIYVTHTHAALFISRALHKCLVFPPSRTWCILC